MGTNQSNPQGFQGLQKQLQASLERLKAKDTLGEPAKYST